MYIDILERLKKMDIRTIFSGEVGWTPAVAFWVHLVNSNIFYIALNMKINGLAFALFFLSFDLLNLHFTVL